MTYLVQAPPYVIAYCATLAISWSSGRFLEHCWHIIVPILVALGGSVLMISTLNVGARYFSLILLCTGPFVGLNVCFHFLNRFNRLDPNQLGNNGGSATPDETSGVDCYRQLRFLGFSLVHPVFLSEVAGAAIPDWWGHHHCRVWTCSLVLSGGAVVVHAQEQEIGRGGGCGERIGMAVCYLIYERVK